MYIYIYVFILEYIMDLAIDDVLLRDSQIKNMTKNERMNAALNNTRRKKPI